MARRLDVRRFRDDLRTLARRACKGDDDEVRSKVLSTAEILVGLYKKNLVKINHSALELVCASSLTKQGYQVKVEHRLDSLLVCDVFGVKGEGALIVEIETGFIPPGAALQPAAFAKSRISSKIARYSRFAGKFTRALDRTSFHRPRLICEPLTTLLSPVQSEVSLV